MRVTIMGAGNMGRGIGTLVVAGENEVELIDRNADDARALADELGEAATVADSPSGDIVVLALPYEALSDAIDEHRDALAGTVVVDIANPAEWSTMDRLVTPPDSSSAEQVAKRVPDGTPVLKAFNTTFADTLVAGDKLDVLIAGDDENAKRMLASVVEAGGLRPVDVGPLKRRVSSSRLASFTWRSRIPWARVLGASSSSSGE